MSARPEPVWVLPLAALLLPLQLVLLLPATVYLGNVAEFSAAPQALLRLLAVPALALMAGIVLAGIALPGRARKRYVTLVAALSLLVWLEGFVLVWDYGALDGREIDWSAGPWRGLDLAAWFGVLAAAWVLARRYARMFVTAGLAVAVLQLGAVTLAAAQQREVLIERASPPVTADALAPMARFSTQRNVLHLILDSFQSDILKDIVTTGPTAERYRAALDGFVFYEENLGVFPYTYFALPAILSGEIYRNHMPKKAFIKEIFGGRTLLNAAHAAGYEVDIATEPLMLGMLAHGRYTHAYDVPAGAGGPAAAALADATMLVELALFRGVPHLLKRHVYNDQQWLVPRHGGSYKRSYYFAHSTFLHRLARDLRVDRAVPVYKFFHLMGPHAPIVASEDCGYAGAVLQRVRPTVTIQSRCTLDFTIALLERMKAGGIYEDALIVIMADHGGHVPPVRYRPRGEAMLPRVVGLATPLLLIKLPGASGPLRSSDLPTSALDVAPTVDAVLGLGGGFSGTAIPQLPAAPRERRFHYYDFRPSDYVEDYVNPIYEYRLTGSAYDVESWVEERVRTAPSGRRGAP